jgi:hypothetical protein
VWGFVGEMRADNASTQGDAGGEGGGAGLSRAYVYTSKRFEISYNKDRVGSWEKEGRGRPPCSTGLVGNASRTPQPSALSSCAGPLACPCGLAHPTP